MYSSHRMVPVCALIALAITSSAAIADLPASRVVEYFVRETPTDAESNVIFSFALKVTACERDGGLVGWKISEVRITEPGSPVRLWIDDSPSTPTGDGLWWIDHADGDLPDDAEFAATPAMIGLARAQDPSDDDLHYDFQGAAYSPLPSVFGGDVSSQTFEFTFDGESTPYIDGADEPTAIDDESDPPAGE